MVRISSGELAEYMGEQGAKVIGSREGYTTIKLGCGDGALPLSLTLTLTSGKIPPNMKFSSRSDSWKGTA